MRTQPHVRAWQRAIHAVGDLAHSLVGHENADVRGLVVPDHGRQGAHDASRVGRPVAVDEEFGHGAVAAREEAQLHQPKDFSHERDPCRARAVHSPQPVIARPAQGGHEVSLGEVVGQVLDDAAQQVVGQRPQPRAVLSLHRQGAFQAGELERGQSGQGL